MYHIVSCCHGWWLLWLWSCGLLPTGHMEWNSVDMCEARQYRLQMVHVCTQVKQECNKLSLSPSKKNGSFSLRSWRSSSGSASGRPFSKASVIPAFLNPFLTISGLDRMWSLAEVNYVLLSSFTTSIHMFTCSYQLLVACWPLGHTTHWTCSLILNGLLTLRLSGWNRSVQLFGTCIWKIWLFLERVCTLSHVTFEDIKDYKGNLVRNRRFPANVFNVW